MCLEKEKTRILTIDHFYRYYSKKYRETSVMFLQAMGNFVCAFKIETLVVTLTDKENLLFQGP